MAHPMTSRAPTQGPAQPGNQQAGNFDQLAADPIFVGGHVRSGTTWIYDLLTTHNLVAGVFESWVFSPLHGVGGLFAREQWDAGLDSQMQERIGRPWGLQQMIDRDEMLADLRRLLEGWMGRALEPQHRYLVEKTPPHLEGMHQISEVFPRARFIHVVRDGRDVAVSLRAAARSWNPLFGQIDGRFYLKQARNWQRSVGAISSAGASLGDRYLELRYEDLHRDPDHWLEQMFDFCGIPHDRPLIERIVESNRFAQRFSPSQDAFRRKGQVGDWREEFGMLDAVAFSFGAGRMLIEKGYERNERWWIRPPRKRRQANTHHGSGSESPRSAASQARK